MRNGLFENKFKFELVLCKHLYLADLITFLLHACTTYSELPSTISTMKKIVVGQNRAFSYNWRRYSYLLKAFV